MKRANLGIITPRLRAQWDAYAADRRGAAAVEFAMIAIPFFFFIFALIEVSVLFIMSTVLEHGILEASRDIRTGNAQENGVGQVAFRQAVCDSLFEMLDCDGKLHIDVATFSDFSSTTMSNPIDDDGNFDSSSFGYNPGGPNEIVTVRVFYEWDLMTPVLSAPLANINGNKHLIQANSVFRNEPFGD
jgi:Flp pilus assembly protein TadG